MKEKNREPLFHIVKRDALPWYKSLGIRFVAILLALILCGIITTITTGINPLQVYQSIVLCFRIRPQDMGHFSEYSDPAFDRIGTDPGI